MKVLIVDIGSYMHKDMMSKMGEMIGEDSVDELYYFFKNKNVSDNEEFETLFRRRMLMAHYDCVISTNFYPIIARLCHDKGIPYLAWSYDTPMNQMPCDEMRYETDYIFLFDRMEVQKYRSMGYERFFHLPLAVNCDRYDNFKPSDEYKGDVAFMGKLYRSKLPMLKQGLNEEMTSYIDKMVALQRKIIGKYIVDDLITQPIIDEMNRQYKSSGMDIEIIKEQLSYTISEYVTYLDRLVILELLARRFDTHLYTYDIGDVERDFLKNVHLHGSLDYFSNMAVMFKSCKINLNGSFRAAKSAIPMRALDILGCGGFLLSTAQPELEEHFVDGCEVVLFRSEEEAVEKVDYYLKHDSEREMIALKGYERTRKDFRYQDRFAEMFKTAGIKWQ